MIQHIFSKDHSGDGVEDVLGEGANDGDGLWKKLRK